MVLRPSMPASPFDTPLSKPLSPARFFFLRPGRAESHKSISQIVVRQFRRESCVYIGAELARRSCLLRDINGRLVNGNDLSERGFLNRAGSPLRVLSSTRETRRVEEIGGRSIGVPFSKRFAETLRLSV